MAGQEAMYTGVSGHDWPGNSVWGSKPEGNDHCWLGSIMYGCEGLRETKMGSLETIVMGIRIHRERPWLFQKFLQACRLKQENAFVLVIWTRKYSILSLEPLLSCSDKVTHYLKMAILWTCPLNMGPRVWDLYSPPTPGPFSSTDVWRRKEVQERKVQI